MECYEGGAKLKSMTISLKLDIVYDGDYESIEDIIDDIRYHCIDASGISATDRELRITKITFKNQTYRCE